jgi:hypothetical protein
VCASRGPPTPRIRLATPSWQPLNVGCLGVHAATCRRP